MYRMGRANDAGYVQADQSAIRVRPGEPVEVEDHSLAVNQSPVARVDHVLNCAVYVSEDNLARRSFFDHRADSIPRLAERVPCCDLRDDRAFVSRPHLW